jgi:hypothetical protein
VLPRHFRSSALRASGTDRLATDHRAQSRSEASYIITLVAPIGDHEATRGRLPQSTQHSHTTPPQLDRRVQPSAETT